MLLKPAYENLTFEEVYSISFEENDKDSKDKLATEEEFKLNFLKRYNEFKTQIDSAKLKVRSNIEKKFLGWLEILYSKLCDCCNKKLPLKQNLLSKSLVVYLEDKSFNIDICRDLGKVYSNIIPTKKALEFEEELERFRLQYSKIKDKYVSLRTSIITIWDLPSDDYPNWRYWLKLYWSYPIAHQVLKVYFRLLRCLKHLIEVAFQRKVWKPILFDLSFSEISPEIFDEMIKKYDNMWASKAENIQTDQLTAANSEPALGSTIEPLTESNLNPQTEQSNISLQQDLSTFERVFCLNEQALHSKRSIPAAYSSLPPLGHSLDQEAMETTYQFRPD